MTQLRVTVTYSPSPRVVHEWPLLLPGGATVAQALAASGVAMACPGLNLGTAAIGIWGRRVPLEHLLQERDRLEIYRPLRIDPKVARRERFQKQGSRAAGLFATGKSAVKKGN